MMGILFIMLILMREINGSWCVNEMGYYGMLRCFDRNIDILRSNCFLNYLILLFITIFCFLMCKFY